MSQGGQKEVLLSVVVPVYNHEQYIEECIHSILQQKTSFNIEVLIGDDCSKDCSREKLKQMEQILPENFHFFYREKNMGVGEKGNLFDLISRAKGKYITTLEGDDFWTFDKKIQKQVMYLENNPDCVAVSHNCVIVNEKSEIIDEEYPECKKETYSFEDYLKGIVAGQTATIVCRKSFYEEMKAFNSYMLYEEYPSDQRKNFLLLLSGRVHCFQEKWSAYRHIKHSGSSFSASLANEYKNKRNKIRKNEVLYYKSIYNYAKYKKNREAIEVSGKLYFASFFRKCFGKDKLFKVSFFFKELFREKNSMKYLVYTMNRFVFWSIKKLYMRNRRSK